MPFLKNSTLATPTSSLAVAVSSIELTFVTDVDELAKLTVGAVTSAAIFTVTVTALLVAVAPSVSVALALKLMLPLSAELNST